MQISKVDLDGCNTEEADRVIGLGDKWNYDVAREH